MPSLSIKSKILPILSAIILVALAVFGIIFLNSNHNLSETEEVAFNQLNNKIIYYLDELNPEFITDQSYRPTAEEKALAFAIAYSCDENNKTKTSFDEANKIITEFFDADIDIEKTINNPDLLYLREKRITVNHDEKYFEIVNQKKTKKEIADTPITIYIPSEAKIKNNIITANYKKYISEHPYDIFTDAANRNLDTTGVGDYLKGEGSINSIKRLVTSENADSVAEYKSDFSLTIKAKDGKLKIQL